PAPLAVYVTFSSVAGKGSVTCALATAFGPLLLTRIVYVTAPPGVTVTTPSVLRIPKSAMTGVPVTVSMSVAVLLNGLTSMVFVGGVTVAVFVIVPVALAVAVTTSVKVAVAPGASGSVLVAVMVPVPPPAGAATVQPV